MVSPLSEWLVLWSKHVTDLEEVDMVTTRDKTKEQWYREAKRLGIKGRSKMSKGQLKAAVNRRSG